MKFEKLLSHPDKAYWRDEGYTKQDLARFYESIFPRLKPFVADRLLSLERCPGGMQGKCFYQKEAPKGLPKGTPLQTIQHQNREVHYVVGGALETEIALVNFGCIAVHVWQSRASRPTKPDWIVFDMDPTSGKFADAAKAGLFAKEALDALGLESFAKTSGSRGLHIFVPLRVGPEYGEVHPFARVLCERLAAAHPKELTVESRIEARKGRVYLDSFRNGFGATVVSPYSVRRREKAPFSMPLDWKDVKTSLDPASFNLGNYEKVLSGPDPWADFFSKRQSIKSALKSLRKI